MLHHYNSLVKISTLKTYSGNKNRLVATATAEASIQPLGKGREGFEPGVFGKTFVGYVDAIVPVKKNDRLKDENGITYDVQDVIERDYGAFPYLELILKKTS